MSPELAPRPFQRIVHFPGDIYVTKRDYEQLSLLVGQALPASEARTGTRLKQELARAHLVDCYGILPEVVAMHSRVKLRDMVSNQTLEITLVYPPFADEAQGCFSILRPGALALLGCRMGDQVWWVSATGSATYWVEAVRHPPEAAGDNLP